MDNIFEEFNSIINRLEEVRSLQQMPGWGILKNCIVDTCERIKDALTVEKDASNIVRLQERYFAYNSILEAVFSMNEELIAKRQELHDLQSQQNGF